MSEFRLIARLAIGVTFMLSTAGKLKDPRAFARGIEDYEILPELAAPAASLIIILVECWLAIAHLTGWWLRGAVPVGLAVLTCFAVAVAVNLRRGRALPCHCFDTTGGEPISARTITRLFILISTEGFLLVDPSLFTRNGIIHEQSVAFIQFGLAFCWALLFLIGLSWLLSLTEVVELLRGTGGRHVLTESVRHPHL